MFQGLVILKPKDLMYFCQSSNVELNIYDDKNFITSPSDYQYWAKDKKSTTQEFYCRWLRKRNNVLMDDAKPLVVAGIMIKKIVKAFQNSSHLFLKDQK